MIFEIGSHESLLVIIAFHVTGALPGLSRKRFAGFELTRLGLWLYRLR